MLKLIKLVALALGMLAGAAQASTYKISFFQNGLGDASADWFGTFEIGPFAADTNDQYYQLLFGTYNQVAPVTAFSATINGISYNADPFFPIYSDFYGLDVLSHDKPEYPFSELQTAYYQWWAYEEGYDGFHYPRGTYTVSPVSSVPLPAALPLLLTGLAGLAFAAWRRSIILSPVCRKRP